MKRLFPRVAAVFAAWILLAPSLIPQTVRRGPPQTETDETHLPNGKLQRDEIAKEDHQKSLKDAAQLVDLAESLKQEIEKDDAHILSISTMKKTEEIEKIARRIRTRMKRY